VNREKATVWVAVVLACALGVSLVIFTAAVAWSLISGEVHPQNFDVIVSTLLGGIMGGLSTYMGLTRGQSGGSTPPPDVPIPPTTP